MKAFSKIHFCVLRRPSSHLLLILLIISSSLHQARVNDHSLACPHFAPSRVEQIPATGLHFPPAMSVQELKDRGNEAFKQKKYEDAESLYRQALAAESLASCDNNDEGSNPPTTHVLFTNLAAVYFEQHELERCIEAADHSIALKPSWLKAYYRKALALENLESADPRAVLAVWEAAALNCESSPLLQKQFLAAKVRWLKDFKSVPVNSSQDLLARYALLVDSRQKLSTMAHFWNASSKSERFKHFDYFLRMIAGAGKMSPMQVTEEMMVEMPLHNYHDLPRAGIEPWCSYFEACDPEEKTSLFEQVWNMLSGMEQTAVVADLKLFLGMQSQQQNDINGD